MLTARFRAIAVAGVLLWSAPAAAQITTTPDTIAVSLASGQTIEVTLTVSNAGADSSFALSLAPAPTPDDPTEEPGTVLFTTAPGVLDTPVYDLTAMPDGRLFVAEGLGRNKTFEFTSALDYVRDFEHPVTELLSNTFGVTYNVDTETLWWLDFQGNSLGTEQALLLEGSLDGAATGREIAVPYPAEGGCGYSNGRPVYVEYDGTAGLFYYLDVAHEQIRAIDTLGVTAPGYPVPLTDYAASGCQINGGFDAHSLGSEPVFEVVTGRLGEHPDDRQTRVVVTDREGRNRGAETSLFDLPTPDEFGVVQFVFGVTRSRLDPSVLYLTVWTGGTGNLRYWVYAVRAAPLPPVWLHGAPILFSVQSDSETELTLRLDAAWLEPGVYEGVASVRAGDGIGPVVAEVPVTLTVAPVNTEDGPEQAEAFVLGAPYPNPSAGSVTVPVVLTDRAEVQVVVYDVLGREVAVLVDEAVETGAHRFAFDTAALLSGMYIVRAMSGTASVTARVAVVH